MHRWLRNGLLGIILSCSTTVNAEFRGNYGCIAPNFTDDFDDCRVEYSLTVDRHFSPQMGAENFTSLYRLYENIDNLDIEPDIMLDSGAWGFWSRLGRVILFDSPMAEILTLLQHEFHGHGFRNRDKGFKVGYMLNWPFPYGTGGGATGISMDNYNSLTLHEKAALHSSGVEANQILGEELGSKIVCGQCMDYREAILYFFSYHDITEYIWTIRGIDDAKDGHDMRDYTQRINDIHGPDTLEYGDLRSYAWINALDPLTWFGAYTLWQYLWCGEKCQEIPLLRVCGGRVLPGLRLTLAPYGFEYGLHAYFCYDHHQGTIYLRGGATDDQGSWAMGIKSNEFYRYGDFDLGGRLDMWWQPKLNSGNPGNAGGMIGGAGSVRATYLLGSNYGLTLELGGKSSGFLPGESLDADFIARLGVTFHTN